MTSTEQLYTLYKQFPNVQTDTRKLKEGDLFFALKGDQFNGNRFARQAIEQGAAYAIIDEAEYAVTDRTLLVEDVLKALQDLALHHRKQFTIPFLAITGSNGKTTTKELVHRTLSAKYKTYATEGNLNNHIGIPLTILRIGMDAEMAIIEMGANHQNEIAGYCAYTLPTHALINNCGKAHLEGFGGIEGVRKGKGELYDFIRANKGMIFRNADLDYLNTMSQGIAQQVTYGTGPSDIKGLPIQHDAFLQVAITTPRLECTIRTQLVGDYNLPNVLAAVAVGHHFGVPIDLIRQALESYVPSNSRSQLLKQDSNTIILDAYNANPSSMRAAIINFRQADYPNKVVMLGGMMELGQESVAEHQQIIELLKESNWNEVILVGGDFEHCKHPYRFAGSVAEAAEWYRKQAFSQTAFLIKGSRAIAMEKILA